MGYRDVWQMPVTVRKWWIDRTTKQLKDEAEARKKAEKTGRQ